MLILKINHVIDKAIYDLNLGNDSNLLIVFYVQIMPD
ncbi:ketose-bisphosphate aldolase, partial [Shigella sonnei]